MSKLKIRKGDTVVAISGASVGKTGKVMENLSSGKAVVEGLNMVKKTLRKSQDNPQGGITDKEASMELSNLQLYCPHDKKGVKTRIELVDGKKIRKCKVCGHTFDG